MKMVMRSLTGILSVIFFTALFGSACDNMLPANPYDPAAPPTAQALGQIKGNIVLHDPGMQMQASGEYDTELVNNELQMLQIQLQSSSGEAIAALDCQGGVMACSCSAADMNCSGAFHFDQLAAGDYRLRVRDLSARYVPQAIAAVSLAPGEIYDFSDIVYDVPTEAGLGRGVVEGLANLSVGTGAARSMKLMRLTGHGLELYASALSASDGSFRFSGLPAGIYGLSAELENYTPDYRAGFEIASGSSPAIVHFDNSEALTLHPVTAVLIPAIQQTFGNYYTNENQVPIQVLQFGGMNQMRLSTQADFCLDDVAGENCADEVPWQDYAASAVVELPAREGIIPIYAQFKNTVEDGFVFVSSVYQTEVIRDVTPPSIEAVSVRGHQAGDDGKIWFSSESPVLSIDIDASDLQSGVYSMALSHEIDNAAPGDPSALSFSLSENPAGLLRLNTEQGLTAGEGQKTVYVYLKDRAGNISEAGQVEVWVDATAPVVESLVLNNGVSFTAAHVIDLSLTASDAISAVVAAQIWEEGASVPPAHLIDGNPYNTQIFLKAIDYNARQRQINVRVFDRAGHVSDDFSQNIIVDDRGALSGQVFIEADKDGNPGSASALSCLINGQSYPVETMGSQSPFAFTVRNIPQASNLRIRFEKTGYAPAQSASLYAVQANMTTEMSEVLRLRPAHGSLAGYVSLEDETDFFGIQVTLTSTQQTVATDSNGYFIFPEVIATNGYSLTVSNGSKWTQWTESGIDVQADMVNLLWSSDASLMLHPLQGDFYISEGAFSSTTHIHLTMQYDDATQYWASENPSSPDPSGWDGFSNNHGPYDFALSDTGDGVRTVYAKFYTPSGETPMRQDSIVLDQVEPVVQSLTLADGQAYTASNTISASAVVVNNCAANVVCSPVAYYRISQYAGTDASMIPPGEWGSFKPWTGQIEPVELDINQHFYTARVWLQVMDAAGNRSTPLSQTIIKDEIAPASGSIAINDGDSISSSFAVQLTLHVVDDSPVKVLVANDSTAGANVWRDYADSISWNLSLDGQGNKEVCVRFMDAAANESEEFCDDIIVDSIAPLAPVFAVVEGDFTSSRSIHIDFINRVQDSENLTVLFQSSRDLSQTIEDSSGDDPATYTLPDVEGTHLLTLRYRDGAGNLSENSSLSIELDREAPILSSLSCLNCVVQNGVLYNNSGTIHLGVSATGASAMQFSGPVTTPAAGAWLPYSSLTQVSFETGSQGNKAVSVALQDLAENASTPVSLTMNVVYDTQPPTISATLNGGAANEPTNNRNLAVHVSGTDLAAVALGDASFDCSTAAYQALPVNGDLSYSLSAGDGSRLVYLCGRDVVGNVTSSAVASSNSVLLDTQAPLVGTLTLAGGAALVNSATVSLAVDYAGNTDISEVVLIGDINEANSYTTSTVPATVTLTNANGVNQVACYFVDNAGNVSPSFSTSVEADTTAPRLYSVTIIGRNVDGSSNESETSNLNVDLAVDATGASMMAVDTTGAASFDCATATYDVPYMPQFPYQITTAGVVQICVRDDANNYAGPLTDSIGVDQTPPSGCSVSLSGYMADGRTAAPSGKTAVTTVKVSSSCSETPAGMAIVPSNQGIDCAMAMYVPFASSTEVSVSSGDGDKNVKACFVDAIGNYTASAVTAATAITLDQTPPSSAEVFLALNGETSPASITASQNVDVFMSAIDAAEMMYADNKTFIADGGANTGKWIAYSTSKYDLELDTYSCISRYPVARRYVYAKFRDDVQNATNYVKYTITLDLCNPPQPTVSLQSSPGAVAGFVRSYNVSANIGVSVNASKMRVALLDSDSSCPAADTMQQYDLSSSIVVNFSSDGLKKVCVVLEDDSGRTSTAGYDKITVDTTAPSGPTLSPGNVNNANYACAQLTLPATSTVDSNFLRWEVRSNGGPWMDPNLVNSDTQAQFDLLQDTTNLLEVRAVDKAGNVGQSNISSINEVSSILIPTGMELKQICGNGAYAIVRETGAAFPGAWGWLGAQGRTLHVQTPKIAVLDLSTLELISISGDGGLMQKLGSMSTTTGDPSRTWTKVVDAACAPNDSRLLVDFIDTFAGSDQNDEYGDEYHVIISDPLADLVSITSPFAGPFGPWEGGGSVGVGISSIDVLQWTGSSAYTALITYSAFALIVPVTGVRQISLASDGTMTVRDPTASVIQYQPRQIWGLAMYGDNSIYMIRGSSDNWLVKYSTTYDDSGTNLVSIPDSAGYSISHSPWGSLVQSNMVQTYYYRYAQVGMGSGSVYRYYARYGTASSIATSAPAYPRYYQRDAGKVGWYDEAEGNQFIMNDIYTTGSPVFTFRYQIDPEKPMLPTKMDSPGQPQVIYQTSGENGASGIVVGFQNNTGCIQ